MNQTKTETVKEQKNIKAWFKMKFSGLHQYSTAISLGIVYETGHEVHIEFSDYASYQVDEWLRKNVLPMLCLAGKQRENTVRQDGKKITIFGKRDFVCDKLIALHEQIGATPECPIMFISDCAAHDWVILNQIFSYRHKNNASGPQLPENIYYIPLDLSTMFFDRGIDPDISRLEFAELEHKADQQHYAVFHAGLIKECYRRLMQRGLIYRD